VEFRELSYASPSDPLWKRWVISTIENLSGRQRLLPIYERWRSEVIGKKPNIWSELMPLIGVTLDVRGAKWPPDIAPHMPLVMLANHPFGIGDGLAILAMAEQLNRPFRVLANNELLKAPEIRPYALPIDFAETREALERNLESRKEARRLLKEGATIIVFPAGGVATAKNPLGKAIELPWKTFTARLVQQARASVLPLHFEGQNGPLFHLVSRFSLTLRLSLLVSEFRHFVGSKVVIRAGEIVPFAALRHKDDRKMLTDELYELVTALGELDPA